MGRGEFGRFGRGGSPMMSRANKATAPTCMLDTPLRDEDQEGEKTKKKRKSNLMPSISVSVAIVAAFSFLLVLPATSRYSIFQKRKIKQWKILQNTILSIRTPKFFVFIYYFMIRMAF